jgi:hypothetical protein
MCVVKEKEKQNWKIRSLEEKKMTLGFGESSLHQAVEVVGSASAIATSAAPVAV